MEEKKEQPNTPNRSTMDITKTVNSVLVSILTPLFRRHCIQKSCLLKPTGMLLLRQLNTTPIVIPANAGIQAYTGCRIKSGMTAVLI
jgi:hypothetical protein